MDIINQIEEIQSPSISYWDSARSEARRIFTASTGPDNPPIFQFDSSLFDADRLSINSSRINARTITSSRLEDYTIPLDRLRSAIDDIANLEPIRDNVMEIMSYQQRIRSLEETVLRLENTISDLQEQLISSRS